MAPKAVFHIMQNIINLFFKVSEEEWKLTQLIKYKWSKYCWHFIHQGNNMFHHYTFRKSKLELFFVMTKQFLELKIKSKQV